MLKTLVKYLKRSLVLVLGILAVYIAFWQIYPFVHGHRIDERFRLPAAIALLVTYLVMAYLVIPAAIHLFRFFVRPKHLPLYCVTPDGFASDPINIGLVGTKTQVTKAMLAAGWFLADKLTFKSAVKEVAYVLLRRPYPNAPFSTLFLFGRGQDLGFELPVPGKVSYRHHVRFWSCNLESPEQFQVQLSFWQRLHVPRTNYSRRQLWVGSASKDIGIGLIGHNAQVTHRVHPDTDSERELIVSDLKDADMTISQRTIKVSSPYGLRNRTIVTIIKSDGQFTICELK